MIKHFLTLLAAFAAAAFLALPASAGVLGTDVTGSLLFGEIRTNFFDAANTFVPAGCKNADANGGPVTVSDPAVEFCFADSANRDSANFTDGVLTVRDEILTGAISWIMEFVFAPGAVSAVSALDSNFRPGSLMFAFANDKLTIEYNGARQPDEAGDFAAQYRLAPGAAVAIPEPAPIALLLFGIVMLGHARSRRNR